MRGKVANIPANILHDLYIDQNLSDFQIAPMLNVARRTICKYRAIYRIPPKPKSWRPKDYKPYLRTADTREKIRLSRLGKSSWSKGLTADTDPRIASSAGKMAQTKRGKPSKLPKEHFIALGKKNKGKSHPDLTLRNRDPLFIQKRLLSLNMKPNKYEKRLISIIETNHLPYKFTGDGSLIIAGLSPDFANCDGTKKLIEIFGVVFHDPKRTFKSAVPLVQQEPYRKAIYATLGFDCLVLWDDNMKRMSDEEIADTIRKFTKSRHKPTAQLKLEV